MKMTQLGFGGLNKKPQPSKDLHGVGMPSGKGPSTDQLSKLDSAPGNKSLTEKQSKSKNPPNESTFDSLHGDRSLIKDYGK